ncbi:MAG: MFS transporter [Christensenellales bacterium]
MNSRFRRVMLINILYSFASNLIHPITPTLITNLNLPDRMFGLLFAAMATGSFLFSAFWGRLADRRGSRIVLVLSLIGYAIGQFVFGFTENPGIMLAARFFGGSATGGTAVALLTSVVDASAPEERAKNLSAYAALQGVFCAAGYFSGGMMGMLGIRLVFVVHCSLLLLCAALTHFLLPAGVTENAPREAKQGRAPLSEMLKMLTAPMALFFLGVVFSTFSTMGFDNAFNFYIRKVFGFPSSVNGAIKAVTGLLGLFANLVINRWIAKRFENSKALTTVLLLCAATLFCSTFMEHAYLFIGVNIAFYMCNAIYIPIQQALMAQEKQAHFGILSGIYNASRAIGMVAGSFSAGYLFEVGAKLPFYTQVAGFLLAAGATVMAQYLGRGAKKAAQ